jgi:hypothetical protein
MGAGQGLALPRLDTSLYPRNLFMTENVTPPKKRRTPEELKAFYAGKMKELETRDKQEVVQLLSGVADDLMKITTYVQSAAIKPQIDAAVVQVKAALTKFG